MQQVKGTLIGARSLRLVYASALPEGRPKALIVLVHGYGEHMGRYAHVVTALTGRGYVVYTIDHRGHGESDGPRANVERFAYFVDDVHQLVSRARAEHPELPLLMIGHSMGGLIAVHYALRHQSELAALVLSGPALQIGDDVSPVIKKLSRVIARVAPSLPVTPASKSPESVLSRDPVVQELFDSDPLCYTGKVRARMGYELMKAAEDGRARAAELRLPLLVMYGTHDKLVNPSGAKLVYERASSADKTIKAWDDCRHEIFNELEKDDVIALMVNWLDEHMVSQTQAAVSSAVDA